MQSQLVPILTRNGYCVANSKVYMGSSPLGNLCNFTECFIQPSELKDISRSPGCQGMILFFTVAYVFYPGVFHVHVLLHLLAKTVYSLIPH